MKQLLIAMLAVACSGKSDPAPQPTPPTPPAAKPAAPEVAASDPGCADKAAKLGAWLKDLAADGRFDYMTPKMSLVKIADAPTPVPNVAVVTVTPKEVSIEGKLIGVTDRTKPQELTLSAAEILKALAPGKDVGFLFDEQTPWPVVVALVNAAVMSGHDHASLLFASSAPFKAAAPPPSAIDAELHALENPDPSMKAVKLSDPPKDGDLPGKVFKDCTGAMNLGGALGAKDVAARDAALIEELPKAIAACGCKVEIASVQRLLWSLFGRETGVPMVVVSAQLGKGGALVKSKGAWADSYKDVLAAAKQGKPVALQ
jgi:hypothetical protein